MFFERTFIIISFSSRHRVQFRFPFLPAGICLTMAHQIENCRFSFSRFQTCLDNLASCLYFSLHRDSNDFCILSYECLSHGWCNFSFINYALLPSVGLLPSVEQSVGQLSHCVACSVWLMHCSKRLAVRNVSKSKTCCVLGRDCAKVRCYKILLCCMIMNWRVCY